MSTKTNFKRVALVAVAALGAGVLSVAPAGAAGTDDVVAANVTLAATGGTTGICLTRSEAASQVSTTPRYIAVGGKQNVNTATNGGGTLTITGGATWTTVQSADTLDSTGKILTIQSTGDHVLTVTAAGAFSVLVENESGTDIHTYYFIAVASCGSGWNAGKSFAQLNTSDTTVTSNVDVAGGATVDYSTSGVQKSYLNIDLNDAYSNDAAISTSVLIAVVTGGCVLNFTTGAVTGTTTNVSTGEGADTDNLVIINDNTPRSCVTTLTLDGTVVATKTSKFLGDVATIEVTADSLKYFAYGEAGTAAGALNADGITYIAKDSAGNVINLSAVPSISSGTNGFSQLTRADGTYGYATATTYGFATIDVNASSVTVRGPGTYKLKAVRQSDGVEITSSTQTAEINKSRYTYTASFDKASYVSGEIMTLTISAKDSAGNVSYDGQTIGTATIAVGGATQLSTIATTDTFLNGKKTYKFSAGATASGYGWSVDISSGSAQAAVVGTVQITQPTTGVSNADVLKAIVSLIASINKQIAALQKALLKK